MRRYYFGPPRCCGKEMTHYATFRMGGNEDSLWICAECDEDTTRDRYEKDCEAQAEARAERNHR